MVVAAYCGVFVWQLELERVRADGARSINEAKERGKAQYNELVASIEKQYMSEFESSVSEIRAKTEADLQVLLLAMCASRAVLAPLLKLCLRCV